MIHSLSGGILSENKLFNFAKVEILNDYYSGIFWYVFDGLKLKVGDVVWVPFGKQEILVKGKVLRIDKNVSQQSSPIPFKMAKKIVSKENL